MGEERKTKILLLTWACAEKGGKHHAERDRSSRKKKGILEIRQAKKRKKPVRMGLGTVQSRLRFYEGGKDSSRIADKIGLSARGDFDTLQASEGRKNRSDPGGGHAAKDRRGGEL